MSDRQHEQLASKGLLTLIVGIPCIYLLLLALDSNGVGSTDLDQFVVFHELQYWNWRLFGFAKQWTPVLFPACRIAG